LIEQFVASDAVDTLRRFGATMTGGTTAFYQALLAEQRRHPGQPLIRTLRCMTGGAAPMPPELFDEILTEMSIPVLHSYGSSETMVMASGSVDDTNEQLANTAGRPVDNIAMQIVRLEDGRPLPFGEEGQIVVGGPIVCRGYADPTLNSQAFDADGNLLTGDLGRIRPDGHLVITGRIKDIIIRKGENVSALEIEHVLYAHPKVAGAAVIGLPDRERGERVCAVVELSDPTDPLSFEEMVAHFEASGLMRQKFPEQLEIVARLPRDDSLNKVGKTELRKRFAGSAGSL
jgi:cyclohexanecarboxylate-CoA ligase